MLGAAEPGGGDPPGSIILKMKTLLPTRRQLLIGVGVAVLVAVALKVIFSGQTTLPQYFELMGLRIYIYGIILAAAILAGYALARRRAAEYGLTPDQLDSVALVVIVSGFVGARLYHILTDFTYYQADWRTALYVWRGGLGIYGAIAGGLLGLWWYQRSRLPQLSLFKLLDFLAPSVLLGQIIGRVGNFFNYEIYGTPTDWPWKMFVPEPFRVPPYETFQFFHPLFLYESLAGLLILYILIKWVNPRPGQIFLFWLGAYSAVRLLTELFRAQPNTVLGLPQQLLIGGVVVVACAALLVKSTYESSKPQSS